MTQRQAPYTTTTAFPEPNYTQTPNDFFEMLPDMQASEIIVTLIMIRNTFGFHRDGFKMSIAKLEKATGLSRNAVKDGAEAAEKRGTFRRTNPHEQTEAEWELVVGHSVTPLTERPEVGQPVTLDGSTSDLQVGIKESIKKELKRGDVIDGIIQYQLKPKGLRDAFAKHFKLTPNWEAKYNRQFLEWLVGIDATPEQVESAAKLWGSDRRFNWSVPTLKGIQEHWTELIEVSEVYTGVKSHAL